MAVGVCVDAVGDCVPIIGEEDEGEDDGIRVGLNDGTAVGDDEEGEDEGDKEGILVGS